MVKLSILGVAVGALLSAFSYRWIEFSSQLYPYRISQPTAFRHVVLQDTGRHKIDYFFPSLGSSTTNVNVYAAAAHSQPNEPAYLRSIGGKNIQRSGSITVRHRIIPVYRADFRGLTARWRLEQASFSNRGMLWRLTASYENRFRSLRSVLLRIVRSFRLR